MHREHTICYFTEFDQERIYPSLPSEISYKKKKVEGSWLKEFLKYFYHDYKKCMERSNEAACWNLLTCVRMYREHIVYYFSEFDELMDVSCLSP